MYLITMFIMIYYRFRDKADDDSFESDYFDGDFDDEEDEEDDCY